MRMYASIEFDKNINTKEHYISPGGYKFRLKNDKIIEFDFEDYYGNIDDENNKILNIEVRHLDADLNNIKSIEDFYIYIEGDITPVAIKNISFETNEFNIIDINSDIINEYNKKIFSKRGCRPC